MLQGLAEQLGRGEGLSDEQVTLAVEELVREAIPAAWKADFLVALARKGETVGELGAFARALRGKSIAPPLDASTRSGEILDVCGTGGDRLGTFNISTTVAIIAAAAGVTVAKHGNRAVTSQAGSADVLEALGVRIELQPPEAARWLRDHHFAFFFAPRYHPAFKHIGPARRLCAERGERTVFNYLGPLLNPAKPSAQLVGVPRPELCETLARVLQSLGVRRGMVVCGAVADGRRAAPGAGTTAASPGPGAAFLDELSTLGETHLAEFYQDRGFANSTLLLDGFVIQPAALTDLAGADREANAETVRRLLQGQDRGPKRDAVLLNAAAALFVGGKAKALADGWDLAAELIDSGRANAKLTEIVQASR